MGIGNQEITAAGTCIQSGDKATKHNSGKEKEIYDTGEILKARLSKSKSGIGVINANKYAMLQGIHVKLWSTIISEIDHSIAVGRSVSGCMDQLKRSALFTVMKDIDLSQYEFTGMKDEDEFMNSIVNGCMACTLANIAKDTIFSINFKTGYKIRRICELCPIMSVFQSENGDRGQTLCSTVYQKVLKSLAKYEYEIFSDKSVAESRAKLMHHCFEIESAEWHTYEDWINSIAAGAVLIRDGIYK